MIDQDLAYNNSLAGRFGAIWGVAGVCVLLLFAVYRLTVITIDSFEFSFMWYHWLILVGNILFMAHSEGYKGFQKSFSPRVAARARYLKSNPKPLYILLAPLFCMGYFHATRRRMITAYVMTLAIVVLILIFNQISQPWRGILDAGVVVGLSWGVISIVVYYFQAMA
ncbi:MAG: hypothetical protein GY806_04595, partial [Gammaproteobacteria bacterium]|nr:hypothetical protein [Gammaproteobacteria bacterium]